MNREFLAVVLGAVLGGSIVWVVVWEYYKTKIRAATDLALAAKTAEKFYDEKTEQMRILSNALKFSLDLDENSSEEDVVEALEKDCS